MTRASRQLFTKCEERGKSEVYFLVWEFSVVLMWDGCGGLEGRVKVGENIPGGGSRACGDMEGNGVLGGGSKSVDSLRKGV